MRQQLTVALPPANSPKYSDITKLAGQQSWQCGAGGTTAYTGSGTWSFDAVP